MAILGSRSSYVWFLRSCRGRKTREKEFGRIWSQRGGKTAGGTRLGLGIGTKLGCRDDWRDVSRNLAPVSLPRSGAGKGVESGRGSALGGQERGVGGAHRGAGLHGGRGQVTEGGTNLRWARPALHFRDTEQEMWKSIALGSGNRCLRLRAIFCPCCVPVLKEFSLQPNTENANESLKMYVLLFLFLLFVTLMI